MVTSPVETLSADLPQLLDVEALVLPRLITLGQILPLHRVFVIMKTPLLVAVGLYLAGGPFRLPSAIWTMVLAALLWTTLYALNEYTDLVQEEGYAKSPVLLVGLLGAPVLCCALAGIVSQNLLPLFVGMMLGQMAYCVPPIRLKRFWWAGLIFSGMVNPLLRVQCGAIWGLAAISPVVYATIVCLHLGSAIRTRMLQRERDRRLSYRVVPQAVWIFSIISVGAGMAGMYWMCALSILPPAFYLFVTLGAAFTLYAWSGRITNIRQVRRGWAWFSLLAILALIVLIKFH